MLSIGIRILKRILIPIAQLILWKASVVPAELAPALAAATKRKLFASLRALRCDHSESPGAAVSTS